MVLTRAFACALPVVASDIPGYREVLDPSASVAVPPGDPLRSRRPWRRSSTTSRAASRSGRRPARSPSSATRGRGSRAGSSEIYEQVHGARARRGARRVTALRVAWRSPWVQAGVIVLLVLLALPFSGGGGRTGATSGTRSASWSGAGSCSRSALNVVSTLFRALSWRMTIGQALPDEHQPKAVHVFSAFGVGLFANAVVPGRLGELARVATLRRHLPDAPRGTSATLVGTVFAHRLFDLVPATILVVWVLLTAEVPHWAIVALMIVAAVGLALFTIAWMSARRARPAGHERGRGARFATC